MESLRRQEIKVQVKHATIDQAQIAPLILAEEKRLQERADKMKDAVNSTAYKSIKLIKVAFDDYYLDAALGTLAMIILPLQVPITILTNALYLPPLYFSLVKLKSIPLFLAIIYNALLDDIISYIPFAGNVADFFMKAHKKNARMITGFVEGDLSVIAEVNRSVVKSVIGILILGFILIKIIQLIIYAVQSGASFIETFIESF